MATEAEINAARAAYARESNRVEGMEAGKALILCWRAALDAAAEVRNHGDHRPRDIGYRGL